MICYPWRRKRIDVSCQPIDEAEERLAEITRRAERVVPPLLDRGRRNHWGEAIDEIFKGRRPT